MRKTIFYLLIGSFIFSGTCTAFAVAPSVRVLPTGGGYSVTCQEFGVEMRGDSVKSCFLALPADLPGGNQTKIACAPKYATAFRVDGRVEYCTLGSDMTFKRTAQERVACKAGGRVVIREDGTVESATLKESTELPYAKGSTVACRGGSPVVFRADGNVANCILDRESVFAAKEKKNLNKTCVVGGLIAFDEDGKFNGCYPPTPPKGAISQGGQNP